MAATNRENGQKINPRRGYSAVDADNDEDNYEDNDASYCNAPFKKFIIKWRHLFICLFIYLLFRQYQVSYGEADLTKYKPEYTMTESN